MHIGIASYTIIAIISVNILHAQSFLSRKLNGTRNNLRHGPWVSYSDSSKTTIEWKGKFKNGNEKGVWKYYYSNGSLRKKEIYRFRKIKTYTFYDNGKLESSGCARLLEGDQKLEYFYYGPWKFYSEEGKLVRIVYYEKGENIKEEIIQ